MSSTILQTTSDYAAETRPKALIVNCDDTTSQFFQSSFQAVNWTTTVLSDHTSLSAQCTTDRPNVIVLAGADLCPEAYEVIVQIRNHETGRTIPVISATTTAQCEEWRQQLLSAGCDVVEARPNVAADVLAQVARAANHQLQSNGRFPSACPEGARAGDANKKHKLS